MKCVLTAVLMVLAQGAAAETGVDFSKMDWALSLVDATPPGYTATLNLGEPGRITGQAPCNRYFADFTRDGESVSVGLIGATKMACLQIKGEAEFFQTLQAMDTVSEAPGTLTLSGGGHKMVFVQPVP